MSGKKETRLMGSMQNIAQEYHVNINTFSQSVIIAQFELLLTYAERFYQRQFITRKITNHKTLNRLEEILTDYFNDATVANKGLSRRQKRNYPLLI